MIRTRMPFTAFVVAACVAGCSSSAPAPSSDSTPIRTARTVTHVHLSPDGNHTIKVDTVPAVDSVSPQSIMVDTTCTSSEDWFFDGSSCSGNELCLSGTGTLDLSTVADGSGTWKGVIQAYESQLSDGYFSASSDGYTKCAQFGMTSSCTAAPDAAANIDYVNLGYTCPILNCGTGKFLCSEDCDGYLKQECFLDSQCGTGCNRNLYCFQHMTCP